MRLTAVAIVVALFTVTGAYALRETLAQPAALPHSLAILPVRAIGSGTEVPASAIDEELNTTLILETGLTVHAISRSTGIEKCEDDFACIGRLSRTSFILIGGMQENQGHLRVTMRLIRTSDGIALWANRYDVADLTGLQSTVMSVTSSIRPFILGTK